MIITKIAEHVQFHGEIFKLVNLIRFYRAQGKGVHLARWLWQLNRIGNKVGVLLRLWFQIHKKALMSLGVWSWFPKNPSFLWLPLKKFRWRMQWIMQRTEHILCYSIISVGHSEEQWCKTLSPKHNNHHILHQSSYDWLLPRYPQDQIFCIPLIERNEFLKIIRLLFEIFFHFFLLSYISLSIVWNFVLTIHDFKRC